LAVYRAFFHQVQHLESEAQKATLTESIELRAWHQKQIGLTAQEAAQLKQIAAIHLAAIKAVDEAASRIIEAQRSQFPGGRLASPNSLPPPPPVLAQLQKQRDDLTTAHVQGLQAALSAASFAKLDPFEWYNRVLTCERITHPPGYPLAAWEKFLKDFGITEREL
jgi:hypothetical protein